MTIEAKNYERLVGNLPGFSPPQIEQHLKLYQGYVKKINEIRAEIEKIPSPRQGELNFSTGSFPSSSGASRCLTMACYLHEMYFDNLGGSRGAPESDLARAIEGSFGSQSNWEEDLRACAETATGGWVLLTYDRIDGKLHHNQVWEHSNGIMINQEHLLALDTWEHAFMIDFGTDKKSYLGAFLQNVTWKVVADDSPGGRQEHEPPSVSSRSRSRPPGYRSLRRPARCRRRRPLTGASGAVAREPGWVGVSSAPASAARSGLPSPRIAPAGGVRRGLPGLRRGGSPPAVKRLPPVLPARKTSTTTAILDFVLASCGGTPTGLALFSIVVFAAASAQSLRPARSWSGTCRSRRGPVGRRDSIVITPDLEDEDSTRLYLWDPIRRSHVFVRDEADDDDGAPSAQT